MNPTTTQNERVFRLLLEGAFSTGNLALLDEIVDPGFVERQRGVQSGVDGLRRLIEQLRTWFPDLTLTVEDLIVNGDKVWGRAIARGTQTGSIMGRPPTGKPMLIDVIDICRMANGKIVEHWGVADTLGMLQQVGLAPIPQRHDMTA